MFAQQLNAQTGELEWVVVEPDDNSELDLRHTQYLDMLNDEARNDAYHEALVATVQTGHTVLDIGTGTGLLALMAAKQSGPGGKVIACDSFLPMVKLAKRVVAANQCETIRVVCKRSDELILGSGGFGEPDLGSPVDVICMEIFDSGLLGEGVLPTMRHAAKHLLKANGSVVPAGAAVYGQIVECKALAQLQALREPSKARDEGVQMQPLRALHLDSLCPEGMRALSERVPLFSFDFSAPPGPGGTCCDHQVEVISSGTPHALVVWWDLQMAASRPGLKLSSAPLPRQTSSAQGWREHWSACWAPLKACCIEAGQTMLLHAQHTDADILISPVLHSLQEPCKPLQLSPDSDVAADQQQAVWTALHCQLEERGGSCCVLLGPTIHLLTRLLASSNVASLFIIETNHRSYGTAKALLAKVPDKCATVQLCNDRKQLQAFLQSQLQQHAVGKQLALASDFTGFSNLWPWQCLSWVLDDTLWPRGAARIPTSGRLMAAGYTMPDLHRVRQPLHHIHGIDLGLANPSLCHSDAQPMLLRDLSQCSSCSQVTDAVNLELPFSGVEADDTCISLRYQNHDAAPADAIVVWAEACLTATEAAAQHYDLQQRGTLSQMVAIQLLPDTTPECDVLRTVVGKARMRCLTFRYKLDRDSEACHIELT